MEFVAHLGFKRRPMKDGEEYVDIAEEGVDEGLLKVGRGEADLLEPVFVFEKEPLPLE